MIEFRWYFSFFFVLFGVLSVLFLHDGFRGQIVSTVNPGGHVHDDGHDHEDDLATRLVVDEALLRVPLPPTPKELRDRQDRSVTGTSMSGEVDSTATYQLELPGVLPVEIAVAAMSECLDIVDPYGCYADYLTLTVQTEGIEKAFIDLKTAYNEGDQNVVSLCHQLSHVIGRAATTIFPTVAESYNYGDTFCWSGYYHGIMEAIIAQMGIDNVPKQLNEICSSLPGKDSYSFNYFNCVHGVGHGLMYVTNHELFDALEFCDDLEGAWEQSSCYGGVYMENVIANEVDHVSKYLKKDDLLYPCNAVDEQYKNQCYLMQTSYILKELNYDFAQVYNQCALADEGHVATCYQSLGRDASGMSASDPEQTKAVCLLGSDEIAQSNCVTGAVKDFISYHHSDVQALSFCQSLPTNLETNCVTTTQNYYQTFD